MVEGARVEKGGTPSPSGSVWSTPLHPPRIAGIAGDTVERRYRAVKSEGKVVLIFVDEIPEKRGDLFKVIGEGNTLSNPITQ